MQPQDPPQNPITSNQQPETQSSKTQGDITKPPYYKNGYFIPSEIQDYKTIPLYRRRWFVVILTCLIIPIGAIIVWSGDVYLQNQKTKVIYKSTRREKIMFTLIGIMIITINIIHQTGK